MSNGRERLVAVQRSRQSPDESANRERESEAGLGGKVNQAAAPCDRRKTGVRMVGGGGALRGAPVGMGSAGRSRREGNAFPKEKTC